MHGLIGPLPLWAKVQLSADDAETGARVRWIQAPNTELPRWAWERLVEAGVEWVCLVPRLQGRKATLVIIDDVPEVP